MDAKVEETTCACFVMLRYYEASHRLDASEYLSRTPSECLWLFWKLNISASSSAGCARLRTLISRSIRVSWSDSSAQTAQEKPQHSTPSPASTRRRAARSSSLASASTAGFP